MVPSVITIIALFAVLQSSDALGKPPISIRDEIINNLFINYKNHVRPSEHTQNETVVTVYISISAITSVDVRNMEYTVDMLLRQAWRDPRLAWEHIPHYANYTKNIVSPKFKTKIWLPDLFFRNGKEGRLHKMTCENLLIRIQPNGDVLYSQKITMRLDCQMQLHTFPMDTQECEMNIGSYGYTLEQLRFVWRNETPVSLPPDLQISEFDPPKEVVPQDCSNQYKTSTGQYTCLNVTFLLSRQIGYWLASTYIPNILIMVVSWLNFWVSLEATPARVNLSLLTLLGLITQSTSYASTLPRVSYIKAIDVWSIACIMFNSGVLLEFAVASHLSRRRKVSEWQVDVRKMVRGELARWCTACQQQYNQRGPSAAMAYLATSQQAVKTPQFIDSAAAAAHAIQNASMSDSPSHMSVRMTKSGLMSLMQTKKSPYKALISEPFDPSVGGGNFETAQSDAALENQEPKPPPKPPAVNEIDSYSRFIFPACFLLYNCFYWIYYLVIMKHR
uniref:Glycine receptor subunit beta n=1 Tax=Cryptocotyle lingua TaxID=66766 RepID=A0A7U0YEG2_9TREM|nr:glycine receptor subunit beta [Cryptocotyle lingua]